MIFTDAPQFLIDLGFEYTYFPAEYVDVGDGETGPMVTYYPAYGMYDLEIDMLYVEPNGSVWLGDSYI